MPAPAHLTVAAAALLLAGASIHAATPCVMQQFSAANDLGGFGGGSESYTNPGTGGVGGASDGFLIVGNSMIAFLGTFNNTPEFTGDFLGAGVSRISFWMNHVSGDPLEIHLVIGTAFGTVWQYNEPFVPVAGEWRKYSANISLNEADWTRILGGGSLADALTSGDRLLFRNDFAPYGQFPDAVVAELGLDNVRLIGSACDCPADVNDDGSVDFADLNSVLGDYNRSGQGFPGDVNFDGAVTFDDLNIVLGSYNQPCP